MALECKLKSSTLLSLAAGALMALVMAAGISPLSAADLKQRIKVQGVTVRLSDIFTDINFESDKDVLAAPLPGHSLQVSTTELWKIARRNNIQWERPAVTKRIRIMREGQPVDMTVLKALLGDEVRSRGVGDDIEVYSNDERVGLASVFHSIRQQSKKSSSSFNLALAL